VHEFRREPAAPGEAVRAGATNTALAAEFVKEVPSKAGFTEAVASARPGPELGAKWSDAAKTIYTVSSAESPASLPRTPDWTNCRAMSFRRGGTVGCAGNKARQISLTRHPVNGFTAGTRTAMSWIILRITSRASLSIEMCSAGSGD
jgi:hypothetical protein